MTAGFGFDPDEVARMVDRVNRDFGPKSQRQITEMVDRVNRDLGPKSQRQITEMVDRVNRDLGPKSQRQITEMVDRVNRDLGPKTQRQIEELAARAAKSLLPRTRQQIEELAAKASQFYSIDGYSTVEEALNTAFADSGADALHAFSVVNEELTGFVPPEVSPDSLAADETLSEAAGARLGIELPGLDDAYVDFADRLLQLEEDDALVEKSVQFLRTESRTAEAFERAWQALSAARNWTEERAQKVLAHCITATAGTYWAIAADSSNWISFATNASAAVILFPLFLWMAGYIVHGPAYGSRKIGDETEEPGP
ncbi:hypothetical protein [Prescottella equi]|uniref:hypothetical protein n=1 Tax=Rhodococcus hoagii TaxID=43767 RepID=UPI003B7E0329